MSERQLIAMMAATILASRRQGADEAVQDAIGIIDAMNRQITFTSYADGSDGWFVNSEVRSFASDIAEDR